MTMMPIEIKKPPKRRLLVGYSFAYRCGLFVVLAEHDGDGAPLRQQVAHGDAACFLAANHNRHSV
jgi:hypothetical protein